MDTMVVDGKTTVVVAPEVGALALEGIWDLDSAMMKSALEELEPSEVTVTKEGKSNGRLKKKR